MEQKVTLRLIVDFMMVTLLTLTMIHKRTGDLTHGVVGIVLLFLFFLHILLNWRSLKNNFKKINFTKTINIFLFVAGGVLLTTVIFIAHMIFNFYPIKTNGELVRKVHVCAANWLFILSSFHLGLNLQFVINLFGGILSKMTFLKYPFFILSYVFATYSFVDREIIYKLFIYFSYDNFNAKTSVIFIVSEYISIILALMLLGYLFKKRKNQV